MTTLLKFQDKGYQVEISIKGIYFYAYISHPCGELIEEREYLPDKYHAVQWAVNFIKKRNHANHHCKLPACYANEYLSIFK